MQHLQDIVARDLDYIFETLRDFTRETKIQAGGIAHTVLCSMQGDKVEFSSDTTPTNAFSLSLYYRDLKDTDFNKSLKQDAIIYVDGCAFRIVDSIVVMGLRTLALERHGGR